MKAKELHLNHVEGCCFLVWVLILGLGPEKMPAEREITLIGKPHEKTSYFGRTAPARSDVRAQTIIAIAVRDPPRHARPRRNRHHRRMGSGGLQHQCRGAVLHDWSRAQYVEQSVLRHVRWQQRNRRLWQS